MEALGKLAGGVAHDFNNMLQAISGFVHFAQNRLKAEGYECNELDEIIATTERAKNLSRQLLGLSRNQPVAFSEVNVVETTN